MTHIRETLTADCEFGAAIEFAEKFFEEHVELALPWACVSKTNVATAFKIALDATDSGRLHNALQLQWSPSEHLPLPAFAGLLTVRPASGKSELSLEGTYEPPFGVAGQLFDNVVGQRIAHGTVRGLLREIASFIELKWQQFVRDSPDIATLNRRDAR